MIFVDSNIPMYVAGRAHPNKELATEFLRRARAGEFEVCTSAEVLQEILYRYHALSRPRLAAEVYDLFVAICPKVLPVTLADTDRARELMDQVEGLGVRDAIHAAVALNNDVSEIASFDRAFGRIPGVTRFGLEPA